jgi:outer membrane receptor protein involved in Fe transport
MKNLFLLLTVAPLAMATPAWAQEGSRQDSTSRTNAENATGTDSSKKAVQKEIFATGVAKGRDVLDLAISTSSLQSDSIDRLSARSLAEIFHNIPGVRAEVAIGEGNSNITIRGLPMASTGAKFLQIQENGLPVVEFGDMIEEGADQFIRYDLNVGQIEAIRGGSSSTFASNSPGGVINLIDKTGDVEGGAIMATAGLDYGMGRIDVDYGAKLNDTLRFHVGGFYRRGEGQRRVGYAAYNGGQIKVNVTKTFDIGYIRFYGKYLNDSVPFYDIVPMRVTGTDDNPTYSNVANFSVNRDTLLSRYNVSNLTLDQNNEPVTRNIRNGQHSVVKSIGFESQMNLSDWTVTERFRYSNIGGTFFDLFPLITGSASDIAEGIGGAGATLSYARGSNAGQTIANPAALNGNGLAALFVTGDNRMLSFDNITNDLRASRVWKVGGGDLTTTVGFYASRQKAKAFKTYNVLAMEIRGDGKASPLNINGADGASYSQDGYLGFGGANVGLPSVAYNVAYETKAVFGSLNYRIGRVSIGGSLRYDFGRARGYINGAAITGALGFAAIDMNGDGVISSVEQNVGILPSGQPSPVHYNYDYLSYSTGATYRVAEPLAFFARYSRGARANSDRLLGSPAIDTQTGRILDRDAVIDYVRQLEGGVKYREGVISLNFTGFLANTTEHNFYFGPGIDRRYRTYGAEFEGGYRSGIFNVSAGVTYTVAKITNDATDPTVIGNRPLGQPTFFGFVTPSIQTDRFTIGTNLYGLTDRYTSDTEQLKLPGYVLVNPFIQFRPMERLQLSLNANNLFQTKGVSLAPINPTIPVNNIVGVQAISGRSVQASIRYSF